MLYALNLYTAIGQLPLHKTQRKKKHLPPKRERIYSKEIIPPPLPFQAAKY